MITTDAKVTNGNAEASGSKPRKDKVLLLSSRGVTQRMRHLMHDLEALLPHTKKGVFWSFRNALSMRL